MKNVIVLTGASGFIGKHLVKELINYGFNIIAITRPEKMDTVTNTEHLKWTTLDEFELIVSYCHVKACIHLATDYGRGNNPTIEQYGCNVLLPLKLLEWSKKHSVKKFISTDSFFGKYECSYTYMKQYMITKRHFREIACEEIKGTEISFVNMRLEHVYGEGDSTGKFIPTLLGKMKLQENILCTNGLQKRDFIYINDVIDAYLKVLNYDLSSGYTEFQVGTGRSYPLRVFIEYLRDESQSQSKIEFGAIPLREDEILESKADNSGLRKIGWKPNFNIRDGIKKMLSFTNE
ncbi:NAD-dependent epimerase/dehydratase family protein [Enterobacter chuandaensis]|uniref:NAD-dependent epimerase/dehydratase n=1 Tax=Enterobacter chuandaensis TaxID=2497875 RepID=A0AA96RRY6_9ENTR|nr:NAD-dependent epimerase/dehydratase [Enterobacter chuandaensis]MCW4782453.1 NAD-dependent epimerase/dehydratase [Enterobacter chuandaensis]MDA4761805.1 NAD-dependent epimerase/dehydratase [Enterobacter chuandaensis]WNS36501.1 NAD-dependent epimerase/dehydratase [Enterobacter chuandaensis]